MDCHDTKPLGDPVKHYWLAASMAKAAGVDLAEAMSAGRLTQDDWAGMVGRCRGCDWERDGGACGRWLSLHAADAAPVPEPCENRDTFGELAAQGR